jgi:TonB family protein
MRPIRSITFPLVLLFGLLLFTSPAPAQSSANSSELETLRPENEEFSILMPKSPTVEMSKMPYHKMELNMRLYLSTSQAGPVLAVVSLSGIKSNPAAYSEMERLNSYVDAFKNFFPPKVRVKDAVAKLTLVGPKTLNGHVGREYRLTIADLSGTVQVYSTRKRFYAVVFLNIKKDDAFQDRFLSSFVLPEKIAEVPATVAAQNPAKQNEADAPNAQPANKPALAQPPGTEAAANAGTEPKPGDPAASSAQPGQRAPISGGVLNGKALSLPKPEYPVDARNAHASGAVVVQVTIDEQGNVIAAHAVSGHPLLQQVSVNAALLAKFSPTSLMGEPVKVTGVITYNFAQ